MCAEYKKDEELIFYAALKLASPDKRDAYLKDACGDDIQLLNRIKALFKAHEEDSDFLKTPAMDPNVTLDSSPSFEGPGTKIGHYEVLELIGEGGMGLVYLAEQKEPVRRKVVLKIVKPGMDSKQVIARFEAERQVLAILDHPNIAHVFDAGATAAGRPYFVMEYVKGMSITAYCDQRKLNIEQRLRLFEQVCEGVHHAHQKGIIHRDLKPSNILVSVHGDRAVPKIIDFGIAKAITQPLTDKTFVTLQGQLLGTPEYMSPEQVDLATQDIDTRSDIYSLGVVLYELLAGVLPFEKESFASLGFAEIQCTIREQEPASPSIRLTNLGHQAKTIAASRGTQAIALARRLHRELEWIPLKAMRKDRCRRYRSASEMADDVRNYLTGLPLIAGPETTIYRVQKFVHKHAGSVATVVLVAAAIILGLIVSMAMYFRAEDARQKEVVARTEAEQATKKEAAACAEAEQAKEKETVARTQAEQAEQATKQKAEELRRALYVNSIQLADAKYREGNIGRVRELLESCPNNLRGWEWNRLNHISDQSIMTLGGTQSAGQCAIFSPDGNRIFSGCWDGSIKVWDAANGTEFMSLRGHENGVISLAFSPDGKRLVSSSWDKTAKLWDVESGAEVMTFRGHDQVLMHVAFSPDGKRIAAAEGGEIIKIWDATTGAEAMTIHNRGGNSGKVAFSPDGKNIASSSGNKVKIWDVNTGDEKMTLPEANKNWTACVAYSPDGERIVSCGGWDSKIKVWDSSTGAEVLTIVSHQREALHFVAFSPDGRRIVSVGRDSRIKVWDALTGDELMALYGIGAPQAAFSPDGSRIVSFGLDGTIKVWSTILEGERMTLRGHKNDIVSVSFSPNGKLLASGSSDRTIKIWDVESGAEVMTLRGHDKGVADIAFSPDGKRIVSSGNKTIKVWDVDSGNEMLSFHGHDDYIRSLAFSSDGKHIVSAGESDTTVKIWDAATGYEVSTLREHEGFAYSIAISPSGNQIVTGACCDCDEETIGGTIRVWDIKSGNELMRCNYSPGVFSVAFSPDGKYIASGGSDGDRTVKIWDTNSGAEVMTLDGHDGGVGSVVFSPEGKRILSGSKDETIKLWDISMGILLMTLPAQCAVWSAAFSPDGKTIAISDGNVVTVFESAPPSCGYGPRQTAEAARKLVNELYQKYGFYYDVIDKLQADTTLDEPIRKISLQIANSRKGEDADKLNRESWEVVKLPSRDVNEYRLALEKAQKANILEPNNPNSLNTLGTAQYRIGSYENALKTLTKADKIRTTKNEEPSPANIAITTMALHKLGRSEEAKMALDRLRGLFGDEEFAYDQEAQVFLFETEKVFAGENTKLYLVWENIEDGKLDEAARLAAEIRSSTEPNVVGRIEGAAKYLGRALYNRSEGPMGADSNYEEMITHYETIVHIDPNHAPALNALALLRVGCPGAELRDGTKAVEAAKKACELTNWKNYEYLSILASAYSEVGDFASAAKWQKASIELLPEKEHTKWQPNYETRLKLYRSGKSYNKIFSTGELIAWWKFDEVKDGNVIVSSGAGFNGKLVGDAKIISDPERGNVLRLQDYGVVDYGNNPAFDVIGSITVATWIKVKTSSEFRPIVFKPAAWGLTCRRSIIEFVCALGYPLNWTRVLRAGTVDVNDGKWHHVVGVYDGTKIYLYMDGKLDHYVSTGILKDIQISDQPLYIGGMPHPGESKYNLNWNGLIDDVRIYSYALSPEEVKMLYKGKEPPREKSSE